MPHPIVTKQGEFLLNTVAKTKVKSGQNIKFLNRKTSNLLPQAIKFGSYFQSHIFSSHEPQYNTYTTLI